MKEQQAVFDKLLEVNANVIRLKYEAPKFEVFSMGEKVEGETPGFGQESDGWWQSS